MTSWDLSGCCDRRQVSFVAVVGAYVFIILAFWRTPVLLPFKLLTVYLHEVSHALACKMTGGKVEGIEVNLNEGGVTHTRGGAPWFILPAGYIGSSFWGMVLILMASDPIATRVGAALLIASLSVVLFLAKNVWGNFDLQLPMCTINTIVSCILIVPLVLSCWWLLRGLCVGFLVFLILIWVLQETTVVKLLRYTVLFIGVMNCMFSIYDIYDDLISRRVHSSDAEAFVEQYPKCCCNGLAWGLIWGFISVLCLCGAVYLSLVIME